MKKIIFTLFFLLSFCVLNISAEPINSEAIKAYNEGIEFYGNDEYDKSVESFKKAVAIHPDFYEAYYNLGQVYLSLNNIDEAIKNYELAVKYEPNDYDSCYMLGELLYKKGYLSRSISYYAKIPPSSELYQEAQEAKEKVIKRQKEVLAEAEKKQLEADKTTIEGAKTTQDIEGIPAPSGIVGDKKGNIFIASYGENRVYKIDPLGQKSIYVSENVLQGPVGLAIDEEDNVYIANYGKGNILKVSPKGAPFIITKVLKPYCLAVINGYLYISEQETNKVIKMKI